MARAPNYILDGEPVSVDSVAAEFTAYGKNSIRDGLKAGHDTRKALLDYLTARSLRAFVIHKGPPKNIDTRPKLYFAGKPRG